MAHLYILQLSNLTHYCGITKNLLKRLGDHAHGKSKSTRRHRPHIIKFIKQFENMSQARVMEVSIKKHGVTRWWRKNNLRDDNQFPKIFS